MSDNKSLMRKEIEEVPFALNRLFENSLDDIKSAASKLRSLDPAFIISVGRGSSDHAATYLKYAIELSAKIPVSSLGPSVASIYGQKLLLQTCASIIISQSGKSPDIIVTTKMLEEAGAFNIALTNTSDSPIYDICKNTIDLSAGLEKSVAATKTYIASIVSGLWLIAYWQEDKKLIAALENLPGYIEKAIQCDWSGFEDLFSKNIDVSINPYSNSVLVLGRGLSYGIALEAALKLKEVCQFHAEAFSSAEVLHGPLSIVDNKLPILILSLEDQSKVSNEDIYKKVAQISPSVFMTSNSDDVKASAKLPFVKTDHFLTDSLSLITSFYVMVEKLASKLNLDPDNPRNLKKVTETV